MNNGQSRAQTAPTATVNEPAETAESLLDKVLAATAQTTRRFSLDEMGDMADTVARSGLYKMTGAQVMTLMLLCDAEGLHPIEAVKRYHLYDGRISMRSDAMMAEFQKNKGRIEWTKDTNTECEAVLFHPVHCPKGQAVSFTIDDADKAGLTAKANWKNHPRPMLRARVITHGIRMVLPGVIVGVYTPDELEEFPPREASPVPRREPSRRENHPPVAETVAELRSTTEQPATPPAPAREPEPPKQAATEWGRWIAEAVEEFNAELAKVAETQPENLKLRAPIKRQQVINAVITRAIKDDLIAEATVLNSKGKRDGEAMARAMGELWDDEVEFVPTAVGDYLANKMIELLPKEAATATETIG